MFLVVDNYTRIRVNKSNNVAVYEGLVIHFVALESARFNFEVNVNI